MYIFDKSHSQEVSLELNNINKSDLMKRFFNICLCMCVIFFQTKVLGNTFSNSIENNHFNIDSIAFCYIDKANSYLSEYNFESAKLYLDSASCLEEQIKDPVTLGFYYNSKGYFHNVEQNDVEAHQFYYKALDAYEKTDRKDLQINIYHNLAYFYIHKKDTESLKKIIDKMYLIALNSNGIYDVICTYRIFSFYYNCMYEKDHTHIASLDSAIFYDQQAIYLYENNQSISALKENMAYSYINLASSLLKKKEFDVDTLSMYLRKADSLSIQSDTAMLINRLWVEGEIAYYKGNTAEAKQVFSTQLNLMESWVSHKELSLFSDVYNRLSAIAELQLNYKEALYYQKKQEECLSQIYNMKRYQVIHELETQYEVREKEQAILLLTERNKFQQRIKYLYLSLFLLSIAVFIFLLHWLKQKKRAADMELEVIQLEKQEAILQVQLQEEHLEKVKLEKYEALLDNHFKSEQISERDEELKELREEQKQLNINISKYAEKVKKYENRKSQEVIFVADETYNVSILQDIYDLINKRLDNTREKEEYIEKLLHISDYFFSELKTKTTEDLSVLNIKYCICFYMDMKTEHIVDCFSVESRSVHMTRHRLKSKLNISKEMDINTFLKQMISE